VTRKCIPLMGYYETNQTGALRCPSTCSACLSPTFCTQCSSGYFLLNNQCIESCPIRLFQERGTKSCQSCPYDCLFCDSNKNCLDCSLTNDYRTLNPSTKRCTAILGYYDELATAAKSCPVGCSTCVSSQVCTSCSKGYYLTR
jgi:proprotein convertase subtilisin/kexin type 5